MAVVRVNVLHGCNTGKYCIIRRCRQTHDVYDSLHSG